MSKIDNVLGDNIGFIELVDYMGSDLSIVNAARASFGKEKKTLNQRDRVLLNYLAENKHWSPFRQVQLQFKIKAPEFITRQFFRHLVGIEYTTYTTGTNSTPWNEISRRYAVLDNEFYIPQEYREQSEDNKQASTDGLVQNQTYCSDLYKNAITHCYKTYHALLKMGVCKEQARGVLPVSFYTQWVCTMSLQAVANFIMLRDHSHAQKEIREYAIAMKDLTLEVVPEGLGALLKNMK